MRVAVLALLVSPVTAFFLSPILPSHHKALARRPAVTPAPQPPSPTNLAAAPSGTDSANKLTITGNNIQVTPAMQDYVEKKLGKVFGKHILENSIRKVEVHLSVVYQPKGEKHDHTAEATIFLKGGQVLRASEETDYMYGSIDLLSHRISKLLRKYKDRRVSQRKDGTADDFQLPTPEELGDAMWPTEDVKFAGDFQDPTVAVDLRLVKKKKFDMPPMTVEDAIVCLDYIGHDFYVFRNKASNDINVVYKRKQVEYAIEAINNAGTCVGILASDGIILAAERKVVSKLLAPTKTSDKIYQIDAHVSAVVAGLTSDANILINQARVASQRFLYNYQEPMPVEQLVRTLCDYKQAYTQFGGLRPFGVAFLFAGWDRHHGFQLYESDPAGTFGGWKATAIGQNFQAGKGLLKNEYVEGGDIESNLKLAAKVLLKTMDTTTPSAEKVEFFTLKRVDNKLVHHIFSAEETTKLLDEVQATTTTEGDM